MRCNDIQTSLLQVDADKSVDIFRCIYGEENMKEKRLRRDARDDKYAERIQERIALEEVHVIGLQKETGRESRTFPAR